MKEFLNGWGLTLAVFIPAIGAAVVLLWPKKDETGQKVIALLATIAAAVVGVLLLANFDYGDNTTRVAAPRTLPASAAEVVTVRIEKTTVKPYEVQGDVAVLRETVTVKGKAVKLQQADTDCNKRTIEDLKTSLRTGVPTAVPTTNLQFCVDKSWIPIINSNYHVGLDGISLPLLALSLLISILVVIYSWDHFPEPHNPKAFLALLLILEVGMNGTFVAQDLILFFVFFEIVLLPMYFMIGVWGGPNRQYASIKFFLFTLFGSALMLVGFIALYFLAGDGKAQTFDIVALTDIARSPAGIGIASGTAVLIFGGLFLGFAIKVPMFPFHTWLPDAHTEAPTVGSVILAAILLKLGTYGFVRIAMPILPDAAEKWAPWIGLLAVIGIIYGALCCLAQQDMKRLIAFSSVAHMGFVMLGIATLTDFGVNAAIFGMVAHGLITGMLFFCAGSVQERYGTRDMKRLGGLLTQAPHLGWILGFSAMASLGLPGLAGFWGEFPAVLSAYQPAPALSETVFRVFMVVAAIGTVLAAGYLLWMYQRVAFGTPKEEFANAHIHDVHGPEWIAWTPMLALIVVLGLFPNILFHVTNEAVVPLFKVFGG